MAAAEATGGGSSREEGLTLLGFWTSPFALRARFALNLKGIPYEYVEEDLFGEQGKSQLLLASNPAHGGKVPVLIHGGRPVAESLVIVEYIDEAFPESLPRLLPDDPHGRAAARFWAAYVDQKLLPTWIPLYGGSTVEERAGAASEVIAVLEAFEGELGDKDFFGGDSVGLVDVVLGGFVGWLRASEAMCGVRTIEAAGGVGGAVRRAGRREGDRAGRGAAGGVQPHEAGSPRPAVSAAASDAVNRSLIPRRAEEELHESDPLSRRIL